MNKLYTLNTEDVVMKMGDTEPWVLFDTVCVKATQTHTYAHTHAFIYYKKLSSISLQSVCVHVPTHAQCRCLNASV